MFKYLMPTTSNFGVSQPAAFAKFGRIDSAYIYVRSSNAWTKRVLMVQMRPSLTTEVTKYGTAECGLFEHIMISPHSPGHKAPSGEIDRAIVENVQEAANHKGRDLYSTGTVDFHE